MKAVVAVRPYLPTAVLLAAVLGLGLLGQGAARPLFIVGCVAVALDAMRFGAPVHFASSLALFCLAPFLRRVVDLGAGYEASGLMLSGPLLALLVPVPGLLSLWASGRGRDDALRPFLLAVAGAAWGAALTLAEGQVTQAASGALKWIAPPIYGMWLLYEARRGAPIVEAGTRALLVLMPVMGLYGVYQYVDPPAWDRYWMNYTTIASIGEPVPFALRVFSTLNAPAGYATFTAAALLLFGFRRARLSLLFGAAPAVLGLLLTLYRTAWVALAAGVLLGLFNRRTRGRAAALILAVGLLGAAAVTLSPAGAQLQERLMSLGNVSQDSSGQERLAEYAELLDADGGTLVGHGFGSVDVMQAGAQAQDGLFVISWYAMGLPVGILAVTAAVWAAGAAMRAAWRSGTAEGIALAGVMLGAIVQIPLAAITSSEIGFLFWSLAAVGVAATRPVPARAAAAAPSRALTVRG